MARDYDVYFRQQPVEYRRGYRGAPGYDRGLVGYGADYEPFPGDGDRWRERGAGFRRRMLLSRTDSRARGTVGGVRRRSWNEDEARRRGEQPGRVFRGYERRAPYPRAERYSHQVPPDFPRYLSEDEYGLGAGRAYDGVFRDHSFERGPLGRRNALFGGEGFVRYDHDYDEQWW